MILWYLKATLHHIYRRKVKVIWQYIADPEFREEMEALRKIRPFRPFKATVEHVPFKKLSPSHKVVYPEWVDKLISDLNQGKELEPVHCVKVGRQYKVVDGNHRYSAMSQKRVFHRKRIPVVVREYQR